MTSPHYIFASCINDYIAIFFLTIEKETCISVVGKKRCKTNLRYPHYFVTGVKATKKALSYLLSPVSTHNTETNQISIDYISILMRIRWAWKATLILYRKYYK